MARLYPRLQLRASKPILQRMTTSHPRATQRPATFTKPAHWSNAPAPQPALPPVTIDPDGLSPTRYGDWEKNGIAIDF